jgi:Ca2+-binding RTX toxin-like protein
MANFNGTSGDDVYSGTLSADTINGNGGADILFGDGSGDIIDGGSGDDIVLGGLGADTVEGGDNNDVVADNDIYVEGGVAVPIADTSRDVLRGENGDDFLLGGLSDVFEGGSGTDAAMIDLGAASGVTIDLSPLNTGGTATLPSSGSIVGVEGGVAIFFGVGANVAYGSQYVEEFYGWTGDDTFDGGGGNDFLDGWSGDDTLVGGDGADTVLGGDGIDTLTGGVGDDSLDGEAGDDLINGDAGDDAIQGGAGTDTLSYASAAGSVTVNLALATAQNTGAAGLDTINGIEIVVGSGFADTLSAGASGATLRGEGGNDALNGGAAADTLEGGAGDDAINGGASSDTLKGGDGADTLDGGDGDDSLDGEGGQNTLVGGAGRDTARFSAAIAGLTIDLNITTAQDTGGAGVQTLSQIENVVGSSYADTLTGDAADNTLDGGAGDDILRGGAGADTLNGGAGVDTADYSSSTVGVIADLGGYTNVGDTLQQMENLIGSSFDDQLTGSSGNNVLLGGDGHDSIFSDGGVDVLDGGAGVDRIVLNLASSAESYAFSTQALASDAGVTLSNGTIIRSFGSFNLTLGSGNDSLTLDSALGMNSYFDGGAGTDRITADLSHLTNRIDVTQSGIESFQLTLDLASVEEFYITGGSAGDWLAGGSGDDVLSGGDGHDLYIDGGAGFDTLSGGAGNDNLAGTFGFDRIDGGTGVDFVAMFVEPGAADDHVVFSSHIEFGAGYIDNAEVFYFGLGGGNDSLTLTPDYFFAPTPEHGRGNSVFDGEAGVDRIVMDVTGYSQNIFVNFGGWSYLDFNGARLELLNVEEFYITGGDGDDNITGGSGADQLNGGNGADVLQGMQGANVIHGGAGADQIFGDTIYGFWGAGDNQLYGEDGDDIIQGADANDMIDGGEGADIIGGRDGVDQLFGGAGDDTLQGGAGADALDGGVGADTASYLVATAGVIASLGDTSFNTGEAAGDTYVSIENLTGSTYDDRLFGDAGANVVAGGASNDTVDGGAGNDVVSGGIGDDIVRGGAGADALDGGDGVDMADYRGSNSGVTLKLWNNTVSGGHGNGDTIANVEGARGGGYADTFVGSDGVGNTFIGGGGNDYLAGLSGYDTLIGESGNDTLDGGADDDLLDGGGGADVLIGGAGFDTVTYAASTIGGTVRLWNGTGIGGDTLSGVEKVIGSNFADSLIGANGVNVTFLGGGGDDYLVGLDGADTLSGQAGADTINGGAGADMLSGGAGNDTFVFVAGQANGDTITDFNANGELIQLQGYGAAAAGATFTQLDATHWQITSADGLTVDVITVANGASIDASDFIFVGP